MRRALYILCAVAIAAAAPASASDLLYPGGTALTEDAVGKPVWAIQAECAGFFGAASNIMAERGDTAGAASAKAQGAGFLRDSIDRLMRDRSITRDAATDTVVPVLNAGRAQGLEKIKDGGFGPRSHWNVTRSVCLDVAEVYQGIRRQ